MRSGGVASKIFRVQKAWARTGGIGESCQPFVSP